MTVLPALVHPVSPQEFQQEYWERQPLVVHRDDPDHYADLLTLDGIDRMISMAGQKLDNVRVVLDGKGTSIEDLVAKRPGRNAPTHALEALYERYRTGSTVVLNGAHERWEPLRRLAHALGGELGALVRMNVYLTPAGARGFTPHYDKHDVFVAQIHGTKRWRLARARHELPLPEQRYDKSKAAAEPDQEFDLRAGDLLYLPRGTIHSASSNDTASAHITIGIRPVIWAQVIGDAVEEVFAEDVRFRRSLPIGFADDPALRDQVAHTAADLLDALRARLSPQALAARSAERVVSISAPVLRHHLTDLEDLARLDTGTRVRRRPELCWRLTTDGGAVVLRFHDKSVELPADTAEEVRYLTGKDGSWFTAADLPGGPDEAGRLALVRTLVREGFLTLR
ncbi:JmjC domain-containing protein [Kitasatospora sp. NBC_01266]|uniref:JmjC domain-containing protein n=1 Tax=Kitasatospora sp. NBC_01266 TaxID=2903572 RepID=UPI002E35B580|nr:cupin domain-containing protein [Kitasatospora sp. NBC_01266]